MTLGFDVHALCLALVALDFVARTWRTQIFLAALGHPLRFGQVFIQSAIGETASCATPLRAGGEPARIWVMSRQGVPIRIAVVSIALEFVATSLVIVLVALVLGFTIGGEWWATAGQTLWRSAIQGWRWAAGIAAAITLLWLVIRRVRPDLVHAAGAEFGAARGHVRDVPAWAYVACIPVSLINIGARVAILPVIAATLPVPPQLATTIVGSFGLLYAQAILPIPAGAGAVDLGFLGGAAGQLGAIEGELLLWWRVYTVIVGSALGLVLGVWCFRTNVLALVRGR